MHGTSNSLCSTNHSGGLCRACAVGHFFDEDQHTCDRCPDAGNTSAIVFGLLIGFFLLFFALKALYRYPSFRAVRPAARKHTCCSRLQAAVIQPPVLAISRALHRAQQRLKSGSEWI